MLTMDLGRSIQPVLYQTGGVFNQPTHPGWQVSTSSFRQRCRKQAVKEQGNFWIYTPLFYPHLAFTLPAALTRMSNSYLSPTFLVSTTQLTVMNSAEAI